MAGYGSLWCQETGTSSAPAPCKIPASHDSSATLYSALGIKGAPIYVGIEICRWRNPDCDHVGNCGLRQISASTARRTGGTTADSAGSKLVERDLKRTRPGRCE